MRQHGDSGSGFDPPGPDRDIRPGFFFLGALLFAAAILLSPAPARALTLQTGIYQNQPKVFVNGKGVPQGIFVDILEDIARRENWTIEYVYGTWSENLGRLADGEIDLMVDVSFSREREQRFVFNRNFVLESWLDVYSTSAHKIGSIRDLNGKTIAVLEGSVQEKYLREEIRPTFDVDFTLLTYPDYPAGVRAVKSGAAAVMVATRFFTFSPDRDADLEPSHVIFRPENLFFAFRQGIDPELVETIDRHIVSMKNNPGSAYYRSLRRWMDIEPRAIIPPYIKTVLAIITGLLAVIGLFTFLLRRQVATRTRELSEANADLSRTHRLLAETQAVAGLGGWEYDASTRRIIWTDEVYRIYGVGRDQDPDRLSRDPGFYAPGSAPVIEKAFLRAIEQGEPYDLELEMVRANGEHIWVRSTGRPVMDKGKAVRVTGNIMDITASKRAAAEKQTLQAQLILAQKMELVGSLAGGVAHDFNNMLSAILGYTELALGKVEENDPLQGDLREIYNAAKRSAGITRQLLAFARKETIAPRILDLNDVVEGMLKIIRRLIGENIDLSWRPANNPWSVRIDPVQIDQILANLCVNARDAIKDVGRIVIETGNVTFDQDYCADHGDFAPGEYVLLAVNDNGCGMDRTTQEKIFEPFFTTKGVGKGTGLGLATVFGIVKQNHGFLHVYSEPAQGTTFKIYLPRYTGPAEPERVKIKGEVPRGRGETILLVEDEPSIRKLARTILDKLNYAVLTAASPHEAIRLAGEHDGEIHLLMTDVVMPDLNGRELAERILLTRPGMKCLYMSGYTANFIAPRGVLDEGTHFIQKPFSLKELAIQVRSMLDLKE
jgi:two-component system sensor histidine kinase EvgS